MTALRWFVCDMDDGIVRCEPTRRAARAWLLEHELFGPDQVLSRRANGGLYEYQVGVDADDCVFAWIGREDVLQRHGFDPGQRPLCPLPGDLRHESVDRANPIAICPCGWSDGHPSLVELRRAMAAHRVASDKRCTPNLTLGVPPADNPCSTT